jgi:hypothetical protein
MAKLKPLTIETAEDGIFINKAFHYEAAEELGITDLDRLRTLAAEVMRQTITNAYSHPLTLEGWVKLCDTPCETGVYVSKELLRTHESRLSEVLENWAYEIPLGCDEFRKGITTVSPRTPPPQFIDLDKVSAVRVIKAYGEHADDEYAGVQAADFLDRHLSSDMPAKTDIFEG